MNGIEEYLNINKKSWDAASQRFFGRTALPDYGPYAPSEEKLKLFGDVSNQKVLEIGCGSGHSMTYMLANGVQEAWGLDLSGKQIEVAHEVLGWKNSPRLFQSPMEENPGIPHQYFDIVYSIYALGWTLDLPKTLAHIASYLKPGGLFVFSWEHPLHSRVVLQDETMQFRHSYHEEQPVLHEAWQPLEAVFHFRRMSTYMIELVNAGFTIERMIEDVELGHPNRHGDTERWYNDHKAKMYPATFIMKCRLGGESG